MEAPLIPLGYISESWNNVIAVILGMGFGFVLESSGFSSSRKIMGTFFGYDFVVLKVFFTGAITALVGILYLSIIGWLDFSQLFILPTYLTSAIVGGVIMGIGFSMGGYCPGTSFCGVAIGKLDAILFTSGLFIGILVFAEIFPLFENFYDSAYLGNLLVTDALGLKSGVFTFLLILAALGMFFVAGIVEKKVKKVEY